MAPLDVVKIRLQLQTHSLSDPRSQTNLQGGPTYKGTLPTMRQIVAREGVCGLWKGNVPAELMYVCYSAIQFTAYRAATLLVQQAAGGPGVLPPSVESFVAGAAAGTAATTATYPLDLLRTRFAAQGHEDRVYASLRHAVREIARDEGLRGFFRGLGPAVLQIAPFMGTFFAVYEGLSRSQALAGGRRQIPLGGGDAAAGALAAVAAKTVVFPLDLVRKRIQVQGPTRSRYVHKNIPTYDGGVARTLAQIARREGVRGLYRGLTVSLLKAAPASTITVWTYERVLHVLMRLDKEDLPDVETSRVRLS